MRGIAKGFVQFAQVCFFSTSPFKTSWGQRGRKVFRRERENHWRELGCKQRIKRKDIRSSHTRKGCIIFVALTLPVALVEGVCILFFVSPVWICSSRLVNGITYYALTMAASSLGGDLYLSTALSGLIEIPGYLISAWLLGCIGRRISLCSVMLLGGSACLALQFANHCKFTSGLEAWPW